MTNNTYYKKMFKVATAAAVAAGAVVAVAPSADAAISKFPDVTDQNVHAENIQKLADRAIVQGFPDGTFKPYGNVTRGQAAKIIAGVLGLETDPAKVKDPGFTDLKSTSEYYGPVAALVAVGAISGFTDNTYKAFQPITRVQMAKIIAEAFKLSAGTTVNTFTDATAATIGDNVAYVNALVATKVTTGTTATTFSPRANVTRGQLSSFVIRAEAATKPAVVYPGPGKTLDQIEAENIESVLKPEPANLVAFQDVLKAAPIAIPSADLGQLAVNGNTLTVTFDESLTLAKIKNTLKADRETFEEVLFQLVNQAPSTPGTEYLVGEFVLTQEKQDALLKVEKLTINGEEYKIPTTYKDENDGKEKDVKNIQQLVTALEQDKNFEIADIALALTGLTGLTEEAAKDLTVDEYRKLNTAPNTVNVNVKYKGLTTTSTYTVNLGTQE